MEPYQSPELMICGGLVTGDLELSSDSTITSPKEITELKSTELKDVVMVKWTLDFPETLDLGLVSIRQLWIIKFLNMYPKNNQLKNLHQYPQPNNLSPLKLSKLPLNPPVLELNMLVT
jgi:hypothetical protein